MSQRRAQSADVDESLQQVDHVARNGIDVGTHENIKVVVRVRTLMEHEVSNGQVFAYGQTGFP